MLSVAEALAIVGKQTKKLGVESIRHAYSTGRVLAQNVRADMDMPPFNRSQMDGFAVRSADAGSAPVILKVIGESAAGKGFDGKVKKGEAVRIMTGARVPAGADSVQKKEVVKEFEDGSIEILEAVKQGQNIVRKGAEIKRGAKVFEKGELVSELMIASLAAFGYSSLRVYRQPRVSILATGSEIVDVGQKPSKDQIRDSNSSSLKAFAENSGADVKILPRRMDDLKSLKKVISNASANSDVLILSGGVSVGDYDFTKPALKELGAKIFFEKVALRPGKPTVFAELGKCLVFGLPGNPVSAAVTFKLFVRKALLLMQGASDSDLPKRYARLSKPLKGSKGRDSYIPGNLSFGKDGVLSVEPVKWGGSSDFVSFAGADCLIFVPKDKFSEAAQIVDVLML